MIPTITRLLRSRLVYRTSEELNQWFNIELLPCLKQVTTSLNFKSITNVPAFPTANSGSQVTIWTSADIAVGTAVRIDADVMAQRNPGVPVAVTLSALFYNNGTVTQEGASATGYSQNTPGFVINYLVVANHVELQVEDGALGIQWSAIVTAQECP